MKKLFNKLFDKLNVDPKEFLTGMLIFLAFFTILAIVFLATGTWGFGYELILFYGGGMIISVFFNLMNPNNRKK